MKIKIEETNGIKKYWVNDVCYHRLEDIPAEFKEYFIDKNNNGIPDQFDDLMDSVNKMKDGAGLFETLFGAAKAMKPAAQIPANNEGYSSESEKPSIMPTLIKIAVSILIVAAGVWLYPRYKEWRNPEGHQGTAPLVDSVRSQPTRSRMTLVIEDPNQAPYHMLGVVYNEGVRLLTFELPDGENNESSDSSIQVVMAGEPGTNLEESVFSLLIRDEGCSYGPEEFNTGKVSIGKMEFNRSETDDSGAGNSYHTYRYSFEKNRRCLVFLLTLHYGNAAVYDPPRREFDPDEQIAKMEKVLKTISGF